MSSNQIIVAAKKEDNTSPTKGLKVKISNVTVEKNLQLPNSNYLII